MEQPTTNEVLKEKIDGLTNLTDERFDGIKETLKRIEASNTTYVTKKELDGVKEEFNKSIDEINKNFTKHYSDDEKSFSGISKQVSFLTKSFFIAIGGGAVIIFIIQYILPLIIKK